ncbi:transposase [Sedimenticola hydrogenitrophicus]|uniref:transposase n=1 Tax=Sedimenticola hydrogenitrophicus TaxID=2967975 RepID=UPI0021A4D69A|nr:transposase [Sedimenticola hydrogenitrophicus]
MSNQKKQTQYTAEFRESAVKLAVESDQPVTKIAEELGVNANTLHTWISKYHRPQKQKAGCVEEEHLYDELKRLRKENKRLTEERDILKKAAAYFAKESS